MDHYVVVCSLLNDPQMPFCNYAMFSWLNNWRTSRCRVFIKKKLFFMPTMCKLVLLNILITIKFPLPCSYNILLIGDSHIGNLKKQFVFTNVDIIGVPGLTTGKLDQWYGRMLHYSTVVILCGGNDVVRHPRTNRPPISIEVVLRNLNGMSTVTNFTGR